MAEAGWNPALYQDRHAFVWEFGRRLVELLAPKPGERILDLGCGTGQLTADIAGTGADVTGIDASAEMVAQARRNFPALEFQVADATALHFDREFDAVFSNAVLHWVRNAAGATAGIARALKPGGRFVAEFGGYGNTQRLLEAVYAALRPLGVAHPERLNPWYYPTIGEYTSLLERSGMLVTYAALFPRPTPLAGGREGLAKWFEMFCSCFTEPLAADQREHFLRSVEERVEAALLVDGVWTIDYCRLRVTAQREGGTR